MIVAAETKRYRTSDKQGQRAQTATMVWAGM
jgi:hypothetical protein